MSVLERALYAHIDQHYRATRQPAQTAVLADYLQWDARQVRAVLRRMADNGKVRKVGARGGWIPMRGDEMALNEVSGEVMRDVQPKRQRTRRKRKDELLEYICRFASENCGATPNTREIAEGMNLSQSRVQQIMLRLQVDGRITFVNRYTYRVNDSMWEPPPFVQI